MSSYKNLYNQIQELTPPISRKVIGPLIRDLTGKDFRVVASGLDVNFVRGYFVSADNAESRFVKAAGNRNAVVIARDNNRCWSRFVTFKELMHLFDNEVEHTTDSDEFETLLDEFTAPAMERSSQMISEIKAFWMALGLVCPEKRRLELFHAREARQITDRAIAEELMLPEQYVPSLMDHNYKRLIANLIS